MKIIAFGASSSPESINQKLAVYAANQFKNASVEILNIAFAENLPLYSVEAEQKIGVPSSVVSFYEKLTSSDLIIISFAEHNGVYTAVFKNLFDWLSRVKQQCFAEKKMLLMATSTGARGGATVLEIAKNRFPFHGAEIVGTFCLPSFNENFSQEEGISAEFSVEFHKVIKNIELN